MANTPLCTYISPPRAGVHVAAATVYKQIRVKEVTWWAPPPPPLPFTFSSPDASAGTEMHFPATPALQRSSALSALPGGAFHGVEEAGTIFLQRRADRVRAPSWLTAAEWTHAQTFQHHLLCRSHGGPNGLSSPSLGRKACGVGHFIARLCSSLPCASVGGVLCT